MPTTLSSGVALTQLAGANTALALAMTVISNLLGILIVPFSISKFIADGVGVSVPTKQIFRESFRGVADFVDQNRKNLSKISAILLSLVVGIKQPKQRLVLESEAALATCFLLGPAMASRTSLEQVQIVHRHRAYHMRIGLGSGHQELIISSHNLSINNV
uniref:probable sodium/metabolite cotransporter BASS4, chloroplastic isoform X1 n=1 Tax=Fragaria vesca subsp. vesca TaxID=101020 RepID=UPI0005C9BB20|nr:PREDICTED: probable sodium/metabolite cotransporter BASS4, chloroplastic isoform X1 [Fragaria vesca subsp. vesca]